MTSSKNIIAADGYDQDARIDSILSMMTEDGFGELKTVLQKRFGLEYDEVSAHPHHIKTTIRGKRIVFAQGVSPASRAFMVLHSLGHYYFICEARRKNIERYAYIYDLRGVQSALHYYETEGQPSGLEQPPEMTDQRRKDRVSFEVGANNFAISLLRTIGFEKGIDVMEKYASGDIHYIVDVSRGGKSAIVRSDRDYIRKYVSADLAVDPADVEDDGVYDAEVFDIDSIDWTYIEDIKLEIHFF
ncbi:hypothetical protein ACFX58_07040 [Sphingomonas sp. NCPPB 2930]